MMAAETVCFFPVRHIAYVLLENDALAGSELETNKARCTGSELCECPTNSAKGLQAFSSRDYAFMLLPGGCAWAHLPLCIESKL